METADYVEQQQMVKQRFQRRFAFGVHAGVSTLLMLICISIATASTRMVIVGENQFAHEVFTGRYSAGLQVAIGLFALLMTHLMIWRNQEGADRDGRTTAAIQQRQRRTLFGFHTLLAGTISAAVVAYSGDVSLWLVDTGYAEKVRDVPQALALVPLVLLVLLIPHALRFLYVEMLTYSLQEGEAADSRAKRKPAPVADEARGTWALGEDGELLFEDETGSAARRR